MCGFFWWCYVEWWCLVLRACGVVCCVVVVVVFGVVSGLGDVDGLVVWVVLLLLLVCVVVELGGCVGVWLVCCGLVWFLRCVDVIVCGCVGLCRWVGGFKVVFKASSSDSFCVVGCFDLVLSVLGVFIIKFLCLNLCLMLNFERRLGLDR